MHIIRPLLIGLVIGSLFAPTAFAQAPPSAAGPQTSTSLRDARWTSSSSSGGGHKGGWIGAAIGAGVATAGTYWAAKTYGENEAGGFCEGCFAAWGAIAIPAGALVGAIVGSLIDRDNASRAPYGKTVVAPVVGPRGGGVLVSIRY
jgi:hypothetical protein